MTIIGIDPGPTTTAMVWIGLDMKSNKWRVTSKWEGSTEDAIDIVGANHADMAGECAIERVASMGMAVGEDVFETVHQSGRMFEAFKQTQKREMHRLKRAQIKMHLCGSMRAKDANIRQALVDKLGPQGTKKAPGPTYGVSGHKWAALAVAVAFAEGVRGEP
jgi:hypothetical protein